MAQCCMDIDICVANNLWWIFKCDVRVLKKHEKEKKKPEERGEKKQHITPFNRKKDTQSKRKKITSDKKLYNEQGR